MKLILIFVVFPFFGCSQINIFFDQNLDWYKPYTDEAQEYMEINSSVKSSTFKSGLDLNLYVKGKFSMVLGITYKNINHIVSDKFLNYEIGGITYYAPTDMHSQSHSIGVAPNFNYLLLKKNKYSGILGTNTTIYLFEIFNANYIVKSKPDDFQVPSIYPYNSREFLFPLSSIDLSIFYINRWQLKDNFSLGARVSLGTNLYSDWDQFKKYAWLGLGLEMGFGKVKALKVNP